jgi:hypothetical protein
MTAFTTWPPNQDKATNYTEEPVVIVSKENTCQMWAGALVQFSGAWVSGAPGAFSYTQISGYNFLSGESDVSPASWSGWGHIRVRELTEVHAAIIVPKMPCIQAAPNWLAGQCSGETNSGIGGISGNIILVKYCDTCIPPVAAWSGLMSLDICWLSGASMNSGVVDVFAFGSKY